MDAVVDAAKLRDDLRDHGVDAGRVGHVHCDSNGAVLRVSSVSFALVSGFLRGVLVQVREGDSDGALGGVRKGAVPADAAPCGQW